MKKRENKVNESEIGRLVISLFSKYPPTNRKNQVRAYQEFLSRYPEVILSPEWMNIFCAKKSPMNITEEVLKVVRSQSGSKSSDRIKEKPKRKSENRGKRINDIPWWMFKRAWDMMYNPQSPDCLDSTLKKMLAMKSYLLDPHHAAVSFTLPQLNNYISGRNIHCSASVLYHLGMKFDPKDRPTKAIVDEMNDKADAALIYLKWMLGMISWLSEKYPRSSLWFTDIFNVRIGHYIKDKRRESRNRPDYDRSFNLFKRRMSGESYKSMGLDENEQINFRNIYRPQGAIVFLRKVYDLLYGIAEFINNPWSVKKIEVKQLFQESPHLYRRVLEELYSEEFQPDKK